MVRSKNLWDTWRRWVAARHLQRLGAAPIVVVYGVGPIAEAIRHAQHHAVEGKHTLVLAVMHDRQAKTWHLGLSRCGHDLTWVVAHPSRRQITTLIEWVSYAAQQNDLQDDVAYQAFLDEIATWGTPLG